MFYAHTPDTQPATSRAAIWRKAAMVALSMALFGAAASVLKPTRLLASERPAGTIASALPESFGDWRLQPASALVVNPQANELVDTLYAEMLNRTYANSEGQIVMLAIAYGPNQSDDLQVHEPLVCYPAQGFQILRQSIGRLTTPFGGIPLRRLETQMGPNRMEPVTYWTTVGDHAVEPRLLDKKLKKFSYSLRGLIPDGLLFRVSSIDADSARAFAVQELFTQDLLAALSPAWRTRLAGVPLKASGSTP